MRTVKLIWRVAPGCNVRVLTATSSSVVLAWHSQKVTWPSWASLGAGCVAPRVPAAPAWGSGPAIAIIVVVTGASARHGPAALAIPTDCPMGPAQEEAKAGMTSVPMSSIVCMTDSWDTL